MMISFNSHSQISSFDISALRYCGLRNGYRPYMSFLATLQKHWLMYTVPKVMFCFGLFVGWFVRLKKLRSESVLTILQDTWNNRLQILWISGSLFNAAKKPSPDQVSMVSRNRGFSFANRMLKTAESETGFGYLKPVSHNRMRSKAQYTPPTRRDSTVSSRRRRRCVLGLRLR